MANVLILGCGTQGLAIARDLKRAGHSTILMGERHNYADTSRYVDVFIFSNDSPSTTSFLQLVISTIEKYRIETIVPMGDTASEFLSRNKVDLFSYVKYKMPDYGVWLKGVNKSGKTTHCAYPSESRERLQEAHQITEGKRLPCLSS